MPERHGVEDAGWSLDVFRLRLELYRLMAAVFACHEYNLSQGEADVGMTLAELGWQFQDGEIENGLVAVAGMTRILLDQKSPRPAAAMASCGVLIRDRAFPSTRRPLTLRDACNKILHATWRKYEDDGPTTLPFMHLRGTQLDRKWEATLHMLPFAARIADLTAHARTAR